MNQRLLAAGFCVLLASSSWAAETFTLPKGSWVFDVGYWNANVNKQWGPKRETNSMFEAIERYEPGGGLQGTLSASPSATYQLTVFQLGYGITDRLTAVLNVPLVVTSTVDLNFGWEPGDFQPQLGRQYSEDDFWSWAASMGQPRPANHWVGNNPALADIVLGGRYAIPEFDWMKKHHFRWASTLQLALPTGRQPDPEDIVPAGTTTFDLQAFTDLELHLSADKQFWVDSHDVPKITVGFDTWYGLNWSHSYAAPVGSKNPLLLNYQPYVGERYWVDPGDWWGATLSVDLAPWNGPTKASIVSGHDLDKAHRLPPLFNLNLGATYILQGQTRWFSDSPLWNYDRERIWRQGDKFIFRAIGTVSLLRLGLPLQLYGGYRSSDIVPGRNTRPFNTFLAGIRVLAKFW